MISALAGIAGAVLCFFAYDAVEKDQGVKVALFGFLAVVCFAVTIFGMPIRPDRGGTDCFTEWDMRTSRTVCE